MLLQPAPLILLTGADGYVATEIALQCLHAGHRVRGTFRSSDKAAQWTRMQREQQQQPAGLWAKDAFEAVLAPDMVVANSFDHVLSDVDVVIHTASPVFLNFKDPEAEMLEPAVKGTLNLLNAVKKYGPRVRRFIMTSSFAAVWDSNKTGPSTVYTEADWSPVTREQAVKAALTDPGVVYCAAKKLAEEAVWTFRKEQLPRVPFDVVTLCAPMVYGPSRQCLSSIQDIPFSLSLIWQLLDAPQLPDSFFTFIDVRDFAKLHVSAVSNPLAGDQRYLCVGGYYNNDYLCHLISKHFPHQAHRLPPHQLAQAQRRGRGYHYEVDCSKCVEHFPKFQFRDPDSSLRDTFEYLFDLEDLTNRQQRQELEAQ